MSEQVEPLEKPRVVVSKCLGFAACRWNGVTIPDAFVDHLKPWVEFLPVCAEVEIGLGVPRQPVRVVSIEDRLHLLQPASGADFTMAMQGFVDAYLTSLPEIDGFLLKSRSPSCGIKDVRIYPGTGKVAARNAGRGFFGGAALDRFPGLPIEDEGRLNNARIREHFLTKLFALARFRQMAATGSFGELVRYHARNKLLLMAYNQAQLRILGRLVANHERRSFADVCRDYAHNLQNAMLRAPRCQSYINVHMHALGYFSQGLNADERAFFLDLLEKYRTGSILLSVLNSIVRSWIVRFGQDYLKSQTLFAPYPEELVDTSLIATDCWDNRDYWKHATGAAKS